MTLRKSQRNATNMNWRIHLFKITVGEQVKFSYITDKEAGDYTRDLLHNLIAAMAPWSCFRPRFNARCDFIKYVDPPIMIGENKELSKNYMSHYMQSIYRPQLNAI